MKKFLEKVLPQSVVDTYKVYRYKNTAKSVRKQWEEAGRPVPAPHMIKQQEIQYYQQKSGYKVLVETGTYKGDMVLAQKDHFDKIYTIEISEELHKKAVKRFQGQDKIKLLRGDSGEVISQVLSELKEPAIFWLDGHFSGGITGTSEKYHSPVKKELEVIIPNNSLHHIILIDDARAFDGSEGYPTIEEMRRLTTEKFPGYHFSVDVDIIRIVPNQFQ